MQLVPDIEFRMARKGQQSATTTDVDTQQYSTQKNSFVSIIFCFQLEKTTLKIIIQLNYLNTTII